MTLSENFRRLIMNNTALLLIDIQNIYFAKGPFCLHEPEKATTNAKALLEYFRHHNLEVIHVVHNFNTDSYTQEHDYLCEIQSLVKPLPQEKVIYKDYPSAYFKTSLQDYLQVHHINKLVIAGMMTHMCVSTTTRASKDYGYDVTLIEDACTTKELAYKDEIIPATTVHKANIAALDKVFATVMSTDAFLSNF